MWIKIIGGLVLGIVAWYFIRDWLIRLNEYLETTDFGKKKIAAKKKSGFKFRDPLAPRS